MGRVSLSGEGVVLGVGPKKSSFGEAREWRFLSLGRGGGMVSFTI